MPKSPPGPSQKPTGNSVPVVIPGPSVARIDIAGGLHKPKNNMLKAKTNAGEFEALEMEGEYSPGPSTKP